MAHAKQRQNKIRPPKKTLPSSPITRHQVRVMPLADLTDAPYNPRKMTPIARDGLRQSLTRFGLVQPIVVNKRSGHIVGGHQRVDALRSAGETDAQVVVVDLNDQEEKALNLTLNNPQVEGVFTDELQAMLDDLRAGDPALLAELNLDLLEQATAGKSVKDGKTDPDYIPEPPATARTRPGQVYQLGNHRLMCGDASSATDLAKLLSGAKIHMVNTDPPYNVKVEPRSNNAIAAGNSSFPEPTHHQRFDKARKHHHAPATHKQLRAKDRPLINDFMKPEAFDKMLRAWFGNMRDALIPGRAFYIWGGYANCANYPPALAESELYFSQTIVWIKQHPVLTRKDFMGNHEWCFHGWREDAKNLVLAPAGFERDHKYAFYGWREGAAHYFDPLTFNASDVWEVKKVTPQLMIHLTEKPVELATRAIQFSSRPGENVLDLFGGSGSTLIGCEQTERNAYLTEMDPLYCDIIVERWEKFSGRTAVLLK